MQAIHMKTHIVQKLKLLLLCKLVLRDGESNEGVQLWKEVKRDLHRDGHNANMVIPQNTHPHPKNRFVNIPPPQWHYDCRCSRRLKTSKF
jgi:hypothetical protein